MAVKQQDEHAVDYYLNNGRLLLAKASNRLMKESREKRVSHWEAYSEVEKMEEAIQSLSQKLNKRRENVKIAIN